ncbi:hypothetical protein Avbf_03507 [Armadillidium vulgare]|nr:hypothetical protein Avbf_03507 [Armadillidium vulgare]
MFHKVLVYGHTWVRSLGKLHDSLDLSGLTIHYEGRPNANIDYLITDLSNVLKEEYNHMMLFTLLSELYSTEKFTAKNGKEFFVKYPNSSFSLDKFITKLETFIKKCEELCPAITVHLMVPPPLDLNHYNTLQLRDAPPEVKKLYSQNPRYKPFKIMNDILDLGTQLKGVHRANLKPWYKKETFSIHNAVQQIQIAGIKNAMLSYMHRKCNTMGRNSYLIDGFHPSSVLISKMWKLFIESKNLGSKKRKLSQSPAPPVLKVSPLKNGTESKVKEKESEEVVVLDTEVSNDAITSTSVKETETIRNPKLSTDAEFESFVGTETERLIYYLYGYASGKGMNYSTEEVAFYVNIEWVFSNFNDHVDLVLSPFCHCCTMLKML